MLHYTGPPQTIQITDITTPIGERTIITHGDDQCSHWSTKTCRHTDNATANVDMFHHTQITSRQLAKNHLEVNAKLFLFIIRQ